MPNYAVDLVGCAIASFFLYIRTVMIIKPHEYPIQF